MPMSRGITLQERNTSVNSLYAKKSTGFPKIKKPPSQGRGDTDNENYSSSGATWETSA